MQISPRHLKGFRNSYFTGSFWEVIVEVILFCSQLSSTSLKFSWNKYTCTLCALCAVCEKKKEKKKKKQLNLIPAMSCSHYTGRRDLPPEKLNVCWAKITRVHKVSWNIKKGQDFSQRNTAESQSGFDKQHFLPAQRETLFSKIE